MTTYSQIEWTQRTWNPVTGCTKISQGCKHCYAERMAKRLHAMGSHRYNNAFRLTLHHDLLKRPSKWRKPCTIFVNSMSDLFHKSVPFDFIASVFETMNQCHWHTFQVLTKRSDRLYQVSKYLTWTKNIWMGVSVESPQCYSRIYDLQDTPAAVKFISCEPLLAALPNLPLEDIHWVIVGGESGPKARPMPKTWVEDIHYQCEGMNVPFFFKQWGGVRKHKTGRHLNGETYNEMPDLSRIALA